MLKLSQLLDGKKADGSDTGLEASQREAARQLPQSPQTVNSSAPVSPTASLFSKGHTRFSSSVSSLVSSSALGLSVESPSKLTGVKEEECIGCEHDGSREPPDLEEEYFQRFGQGGASGADGSFFSFVDCSDSYDLADTSMDLPKHSFEKRCSDSSSLKGISRINSQISTLSTRWKSKRTPESPVAVPRSRANSAASSTAINHSNNINNNPVSPSARVDAHIPPSPAATFLEGRPSVSDTQPIDINNNNYNGTGTDLDCTAADAATPLLPPFMGGDDPAYFSITKVNSPLQSPSVADMTTEDSRHSGIIVPDPRVAGLLPSPPLSSKPSIASFNRPRTSNARAISGEAPPFMLSDPKDEWAHKLGHANFTIQPEPYVPEVCDAESFRQLRADWDLARCNFAKHLVRTGEHYGITSNIYKLTEEKWEAINREWKQNHEALVVQFDINGWEDLGLTRSALHPCEQIKLPRLHDNDKFPELGDEEIVGPMSVAPAGSNQASCRSRSSKKRNLFKFFQNLMSRS